MMLAYLFGLGSGELLVIMIVALLLFGSRLPEVAKSLGKGVFEFKKGLTGIDDPIKSSLEDPAKKP